MRALSQRLFPPEVGPSAALVFALLVVASAAIALLPLTIATAIVLGSIALTLILIRVEYGIYLTVFSIPFGSLRELSVGPASLTLTEFLVPLVVAGWVMRLVAQRETSVRFTPLFPFLALFLVTLVLSATVSRSFSLSAKELLKWTEFALLFLVVANVMTGRRQIATVVLLLLLATNIEALHGWYQFVFRKGPEGFLIGGRFLRAFGTFGQPNPYAGYLGLTLPLLLGLLVGARWSLSMRIDWGFVILMAGAGVIFVALLMSFSRGALLGLGVAVGLMLSIRSRRSLVLLLTGIVIATAVGLLGALDLLPAQMTERLSTTVQYFGVFDVTKVNLTPQNWAIVERMAYWQSAWEMFKDHWISGVGIGNFSAYYPEYAFPDWQTGALGHAHNYYLNLLAESGLPGFLAYLAFMLAVFVFALRTLARVRTASASSGSISPGQGLLIVTLSHSEGSGAVEGPPPARCFVRLRRTQHDELGPTRRRPFVSSGWDWFSAPYPLALGLLGVLVELSVHNFFDVLYVHGMAVQLGLVLGLLAALSTVRLTEWQGEGAQHRND